MAQPVLNPVLYNRLKQLFGEPGFSHRGEAMKNMRVVKDPDGKLQLVYDHPGETYNVSCPYCNDTRKRLSINHMFGKTDPQGRRMTFLAICFNEGCLLHAENRDDLAERLETYGSLDAAQIRPGVVVSEAAQVVQPPGPLVLVNALSPRHPARAYLEGDRGFDADVLAEKFQVSYCEDSHFYLAAHRIIIPVLERGQLKGWQARFIGELDWKCADREKRRGLPPKYFSCPGASFRSKCIYNFDAMKEWETGVTIEGPTDVWRAGSMTGCIFGNTVTQVQRRRLTAVFSRRTSLIHVLDPEEWDKRANQNYMRTMEAAMPGKFCGVKLPDGTDPGSLDRAFFRAFVKEEAAKRGVKVVYRKVRP